MQQVLLRSMLEELASLVDESLIPQTTLVNIGRRLANDIAPRMEEVECSQNGKPMLSSFASATIDLHEKIGNKLSAESIQADHIKFRSKTCPFRNSKSISLCTMMTGIMGGLAYTTFGYSKTCIVKDLEDANAPCGCDLYISPSKEAQARIGIEYTKGNLGLLKGGDDKFVASQRNSRRKLILGLFSGLAHTIRSGSSNKQVIKEFIQSLSCVPEIRIAAFYLKDTYSNEFSLAGHFGIPQEILPIISIIQADKDPNADHSEKKVLALVEDFNGSRMDIANNTQVRSYLSIKIKEGDLFIGVLNVGWKSSVPISPEMSEALRAACDILGLCLSQRTAQSELEDAYGINVAILNELVKTVDQYSMNHSQRVAELARDIALEMNLPEIDIALLSKAALLHDVGKICVPSNILNKEGPLDDDEYRLVCEHPVIGAKLVSPVSSLRNIAPIILHHHERLDGSGYPDRLTEDFIPPLIRILSVADVFDAMTAPRSYRAPLKISQAIEEILKDSGTKFDPAVTGALMSVLKKKGKRDREEPQNIEVPKVSIIRSIMNAARKEQTPA